MKMGYKKNLLTFYSTECAYISTRLSSVRQFQGYVSVIIFLGPALFHRKNLTNWNWPQPRLIKILSICNWLKNLEINFPNLHIKLERANT